MENKKPILLKDIWPIENTGDYKIHFARKHPTEGHPLDVWIRSKEEWQGWQEYRPANNDFNKRYIFSLMQFYHEDKTWLFGGIFEVIKRHDDRYEVKLNDDRKNFIGRLKIYSPYTKRSPRVTMEAHYNKFEVKEILDEEYSGRSFPGFDEINLDFGELESLIRNDRTDWKTALENVKGIYLITDKESKKRYVGSAYGSQGVWSRWKEYIETGHGGNDGLRELVKENGSDYCRNFHFALIEYWFPNTPDEKVLYRENYWKEILLTRDETGLNQN